MGGDSKKAPASSQAATPAPTQAMQTIQPAMPGQLEALAQQLSAGFGQSAPDMLAYIQQFHRPMQVPDYSKGFVPPTNGAAATPAPTQSGGSTSRSSNRLSPEEIFKRTSR
jgi:hypothetical protein